MAAEQYARNFALDRVNVIALLDVKIGDILCPVGVHGQYLKVQQASAYNPNLCSGRLFIANTVMEGLGNKPTAMFRDNMGFGVSWMILTADTRGQNKFAPVYLGVGGQIMFEPPLDGTGRARIVGRILEIGPTNQGQILLDPNATY